MSDLHTHCDGCKEEIHYSEGAYGTTCTNCGRWVLLNGHDKDRIKFVPRRTLAFIKRFHKKERGITNE